MSNKLKALIVDDERQSRENLKIFLGKHCKNINIVKESGTIEDSLTFFEAEDNKIDLAFLDINLSDGLIFKLLDQLDTIDFEIIFVTAFEEHAIRACQYSSIGYIMKPIDAAELKEAVSRVRPGSSNFMNERLDLMRQVYQNPNVFTKMSISALDGIHFIDLKDIVRFEADNNYTYIYLREGERITASKTIKLYEEQLASANFYRVHKSHVINLNYMRKYVKGDGGYLVMDDGMKIEVSRRRRPAFLERIKLLEGGIL